MNAAKSVLRSGKPNPFALTNKKIFLFGSDSAKGKATQKALIEMDAEIIDGEELYSKTCDGMVFLTGTSIESFLQKSSSNKEELIEFFTKRFLEPFSQIQEALKNNKINKGGSIVIEKIKIDFDMAKINSNLFNIEDGINSMTNTLALNIAKNKIRINTITTKINAMDGDFKDLSNSVIYLLSDASQWVTGSNLVLTGNATR